MMRGSGSNGHGKDRLRATISQTSYEPSARVVGVALGGGARLMRGTGRPRPSELRPAQYTWTKIGKYHAGARCGTMFGGCGLCFVYSRHPASNGGLLLLIPWFESFGLVVVKSAHNYLYFARSGRQVLVPAYGRTSVEEAAVFNLIRHGPWPDRFAQPSARSARPPEQPPSAETAGSAGDGPPRDENAAQEGPQEP